MLNDTLTIEGDQAHYLRNVLRLKPGHSLVFFTQDGQEFHSTIDELARHHVVLTQITPSLNPVPPSTLSITVVQGISSGDRMDYTVQKSAELGAHRLIPVFTDHCAQKIAANKRDKKVQHWQQVANSACEQSGRCDLLSILPIQSLEEAVASLDGPVVFLEPTAVSNLHDLQSKAPQSFNVLIGPEGGFSDAEIKSFKANGFTGIQLGRRILRTETAAPVILAAAHALFGDFIAD